MIQRIQSIWLLLASLALFALFVFPSLNLHQSGAIIQATGVYQHSGDQTVQVQAFTLLTVFTVIVALLPLIVIFLYRDRKRQTVFCYLTIAITIAYGYWLARAAKGVPGSETASISDFGIGALLPSMAIIFILFAAKAIRKDEKLVRSADRLR